jgi:AraC-like DNA-binding protein
MIKWLTVFLGSLLFLLISHILLMIDLTVEGSYIFIAIKTIRVVSALSLIGILASPFFFPEILYGLPRFPEPNKIIKTEAIETPSLPKASKNISKQFESTYLHAIDEKADAYMKEFRPYLQADINLIAFSKLINIPAHHLAYCFRELKQQSFNDYRNEWRIKHAKKLIVEGKSSELSMEGIGLLSGFSSRNTFYSSFKKVEGISPGSFSTKLVK